MENEDDHAVSKNEIDSSISQDSSKEDTTLKNRVLDKYDSHKLKTCLIKVNLGMPEESGGKIADEKDLEESSPCAAEKKINGEVSDASVPKENGSNTGEDEEMAPLSIDVEGSVEEGRGGAEGKKVESSLKRKLDESYQDSSSSDEETHSASPVEFRGFKKRMIAKAEKSLQKQRQISETENCDDDDDEDVNVGVAETESPTKSKVTGADDKEEAGNQLTEYAQYLGLQPTVKFKCYRCGEKNFQSMGSLNEHQTNCNKANEKNNSARPPLSPQVDSNPSTNFRITRKVYLCSACGTYYENWKLFLHMRDVHKRHICLYCLGMFAVADKLAEHLVMKHKVVYQSCSSPEEFLNISKGSGYLTCCSCERIFTERENFFDHECKVAVTNVCSRESTQILQPDVNVNRNTLIMKVTNTAEQVTMNNHNCSSAATGSKVLSKCVISLPSTLVRSGKPAAQPRTQSTSQGAVPDGEFIDASSFCHVDMDDAPSKKSPPIAKNPPIVEIDSDSLDESTSPVASSKLLSSSTEKPIFKMFPILKKISDLTIPKSNVGSGARVESEKVMEKSDGKNSSPKNKKQIQGEKSRDQPIHRTRSTARNVGSAVSREEKKLQMKEKLEESSAFDDDSLLNLAKVNEAISREYCSIEGDSDSNDSAEKTSETIVEKEKIPCGKQISSTKWSLEHSPLFMEVVNESDNETLDEDGEEENQDDCGSVQSSSKVDERKSEAENKKSRIEVVVARKEGEDNGSKEEKNCNKGVEVEENKKEEDSGSKKERNNKNRIEDVEEKEEELNESKEGGVNKSKEEEVSKSKEEEVSKSKEEEVNNSKEEEIKKSKEGEVRTSKEGEVSRSREGEVNKSKEGEVNENKEREVNKNKEGEVNKSNEGEVSKSENWEEANKNTREAEASKNRREAEEEEGPSKDREEETANNDRKEEEKEANKDREEKEQQKEIVDKSVVKNTDESDAEKSIEDNNDSQSANVVSNGPSSSSEEAIVSYENSEKENENDHLNKDIDTNDKECNDRSNDEDLNESKQNGAAELAQNVSENSKSCNDEDNKSVDSDKLSVVLSEASSNDGDSNSDDEEEEESKIDVDNAVHSESESQAMTTEQTEEILNGGSESEKIDDVTEETSFVFEGETLQIASKEVMAMALTLENKMDSLSAQSVIKECIRTSCTTCGYCNHAVKIGVNGKQLAIHLLAEHRYKPVKNETVEDVIDRLKQALSELKDVWFNTDSYDSSDKSCFVPFDHTYECFQCNFVTKMLKDLIVHKRKVHQKTILYCSMCKANFYSYSELLCHMCPGVYVSEDIQFRCCFCDIDRIPSAFRLMVHLRKSHHTCDICLDIPGDQQKLSTHMWKHKLHHICYRCGIAYRNKPDITKHLFWKHGTESVLCKKCLQKKWPHVYHFCIPPTVFICEECNISFSRAVALKVHKRIHAGDYPYSCTECSKKFVSQKILDKHIQSHNEPPVQKEEISKNETPPVTSKNDECDNAEKENENPTCENNRQSEVVDGEHKDLTPKKQEHSEEHSSKSHKKKNKKDRDKKSKPVVDVYDLPPLNLSSESDDSDDEKNSTKTNDKDCHTNSHLPVESDSQLVEDINKEKHSSVEQIGENSAIVTEPSEILNTSDDNLQSAPVVDGIWDNFHSYKAEQEKRESSDPNCKPPRLPYPLSALPDSVSTSIVLGDHDYCVVERREEPLSPSQQPNQQIMEVDSSLSKTSTREHSSNMDHDYCTVSNSDRSNVKNAETSGDLSVSQTDSKSPGRTTPKKKQKSPRKSEKHSSSSSDSSSDSDSSSCSNSNCSCCSSGTGSSSSSSSDSDSSSSEGKQRQEGKRDRKKEKTKSKKKDEPVPAAAAAVAPDTTVQEEEPVVDLPIEPEEPPIRESDLDTDESSTDEDFYDQYPQRHANQMLAEKRNQLMVLATVAPVNNGIASPPLQIEETTPAIVLEEQTPPPPKPSPVKRGRKRRRKGPQTKNHKLSHEAQPSTSFERTAPESYSTPNQLVPATSFSTPNQSRKREKTVETDKRLSKRRRVPNKFYGYSSDEDDEIQQASSAAKWRKVEPSPPPTPAPVSPPPPQPEAASVSEPSVSNYQEDARYSVTTPRPASSSSSSSASSGSESDDSDQSDALDPIAPPPAVVVNPPTEKDEKLYCYCQCPYDEVSEMIACDGNDCAIEWFHFECVGIMVPPKGKWYCPDCKRQRELF